jgi:hypothetical protein
MSITTFIAIASITATHDPSQITLELLDLPLEALYGLSEALDVPFVPSFSPHQVVTVAPRLMEQLGGCGAWQRKEGRMHFRGRGRFLLVSISWNYGLSAR